jgi:LysM repeat protein
LSKFITTRLVGLLASLALALGLGVGASAPAAAGGHVWDRVAACESGGRWKINTGNGYYGGLQFSYSTWRAFGGGKYARTANRATKSEQINIAKRVLRAQGPRAWPTCSIRAGLTRANGGAVKVPNHATAVKKRTTVRKVDNSKIIKIRVRSGDTLGRIANRHDVRGGWQAIWRLNKGTLRSPHVLRVGQVLKIAR